MLEALLISCILGLPTAFIVSILSLNFYNGPFTNYDKSVYSDFKHVDTDESYGYVSLLSHIRQFLSLGKLYKKYDNRWVVESSNAYELFSCPYCLSFWIAIPFAFFVPGPYLIIYWLTIAAVSTILNLKLL